MHIDFTNKYCIILFVSEKLLIITRTGIKERKK